MVVLGGGWRLLMSEVPLYDLNNDSICYSVILDLQGLLANEDTQFHWAGPVLLGVAIPQPLGRCVS